MAYELVVGRNQSLRAISYVTTKSTVLTSIQITASQINHLIFPLDTTLSMATKKATSTNIMAKDLFHNAVKQALIKEQWVITADPLNIKIEGVKLEVDLAAEKVLAAEKAGQKIAVEIKSFLKPSTITDFHTALGQFLNYRVALQMDEPNRILYLAVPTDTFESFFQEEFIQVVVTSFKVKLIVYNPVQEAIILWKE